MRKKHPNRQYIRTIIDAHFDDNKFELTLKKKSPAKQSTFKMEFSKHTKVRTADLLNLLYIHNEKQIYTRKRLAIEKGDIYSDAT